MNSKPKYSTLVRTLRELNDTIIYGLFSALSAKELSDQPCYVAIKRVSDRAEKLLNRLPERRKVSVSNARLASKLEAIGRAQKAIPGEPCGGVKYGSSHDCKNPRHTEYFNLTVERERVRELMARANRLPNGLGVL